MSQERQPYSGVRRLRNPCKDVNFDMKEILKQEIYKQSNDSDTYFRFGLSGPVVNNSAPGAPASQSTDITSLPNVGFEDYEFHFDSLNKDSSSDLTSGELKWSINLLNNSQDIRNCIEIKLGSFFFPRLTNAAAAPDYYFYRRVYMLVENLPSTQAIVAANGNQYHFEFEVVNLNSVAVQLNPLQDTIFFQRPITSLSDFQVRFMVPHGFQKIPIPKDTVNMVSVFNTNPAQFQLVGGDLTTSVLGPIGVPAAPGIAAYISGFVSGNTTLNNQVNTSQGIFITNIIDAVTFSITGIDFTGVAATPASMIIPKNRVAFPVRFTSVRDQATNYTTVGHL